MEVDEEEFASRLLDYRRVLFLCHRSADPDALGSAFALAQTFGGEVGLVEGCNRIATVVRDYLGIEVVPDPQPDDYELVVVVDTPTSSQLNNFPLQRYAVIDHHTTASLNPEALFHLHRNRTSTSEIVLEVLKKVNAPILRRTGCALLAGVITDTGNFKHATAQTFRAVADIIELSGVEYTEVMDMLTSIPQDTSMRIAMLKTAQRSRMERVGDWIITTSTISSFGGASASMLTSIGADIALVASQREGGVKVSGRARRPALSAGINLGEIMEEISRRYQGTGGGHAGAAGMDVQGDPEEILEDCVAKVKSILEEKVADRRGEVNEE